jgi:asparagine synthase (glutamine-hydrolysing)
VCGIAGIYRRGERPPSEAERAADRALVREMLKVIRYRGPDDEGLECVGRVTLGVRRLSILDVAGGHQPLHDVSGRVWAMQNGELYDFAALRRDLSVRHTLRTHTDTELLPYLWLEQREDFLRSLRGMFALAVYDTADETLLLARDPVGVKPLYVAECGDRLLFASELKALLCDPALPRELDDEALIAFLGLGWMPAELTPFRAVRRVLPGCRLVLTPRGRRDERYWEWPRFFADRDAVSAPIERLADEACRRLGQSAVSMLMSDRPLGVLLSGGLDSSLLVALLPEEVRHEIRTFSIGFEDAGHHDERHYAGLVARHLGTRHREYTVPLEVAVELPRVMTYLDEPLADPAAVPAHLVARAAASEVTVLLSGTGGDEVFGGYLRHRLPGLLRWARCLPRPLAAAGARLLGDRALHRRSVAGERLVHLRKLLEARGRPDFLSAYLAAFEPAPSARWSEAFAGSIPPGRVVETMSRRLSAGLGRAPEGPAETALAVDHLFYLPDDLLLKEDRTTMGASVEGRVPYLDPPLVHFAAGLPLATRFEDGLGKRLLRVVARRLLPSGIADRPKHGFSVPIEDWLRGPLDGLVGDVFSGPGSGVFRMEALRRWHSEHRSGRDRSGALWAALSFELWWRLVGSAPPARVAGHGPAPGGQA